MKKILLLGGSRYLLPVIEEIHKLGYYAITCDYLPDNIAHKYSDEYHNVSIIEKDKVLELAQRLKIDGIMSFACDPGVETAAYVAEKMGLSFQGSYESTRILQNKGLFRKFLAENDFNCPHAKSYTNIEDALKDKEYFDWPVIVKPVDSAGSKGITKVEKYEDLREAIETAIKKSHCDEFIIEDFITFKGYHSVSDCFTVNGELKFCTFSDHLFDSEAANPYTPVGIIWPTTMSNEDQKYLTSEIQRLMTLLNMKTGIYNIETCVGNTGKPYIMEVSPRGGGGKIAEIQYLFSGINLIEAEVKNCVGEEIPEIYFPGIDGYWLKTVIHTKCGQTGIFEKLEIDPEMNEKHVKMIELTPKPGDYIEELTGADKCLGDMFFKFDSRKELDEAVKTMDEWFKIKLK